ncbi:uncharacterized protein LOC128339438 [Hemicordylus capensis]|uniref:uncharacterized protein LOC128339438 n=1 Tax=Hemicordylus capensis TaxID=884348 RepID=UPI0023047359|nr:uncharacterized protein LOC128339438 [Hemicordylus capensis]
MALLRFFFRKGGGPLKGKVTAQLLFGAQVCSVAASLRFQKGKAGGYGSSKSGPCHGKCDGVSVSCSLSCLGPRTRRGGSGIPRPAPCNLRGEETVGQASLLQALEGGSSWATKRAFRQVDSVFPARRALFSPAGGSRTGFLRAGHGDESQALRGRTLERSHESSDHGNGGGGLAQPREQPSNGSGGEMVVAAAAAARPSPGR